MFIKRLGLAVAAIGATFALAGSVKAQTVVQNFSFGPNSGAFSIGNFSAPAWAPLINQFDASLGILTAVEIDWTTSMESQLQVTNITGFTGSPVTYHFYNASSSTTVQVQGPSGAPMIESTTSGVFGTKAVPIAAIPGVGPLFGSGIPVVASDSKVYISGLSAWEGSGLAPLNDFVVSGGSITASGSSDDAPGSTLFYGGADSISGSGQLIYHYIAVGSVPEPGMTTFLAAGVLGSLGMVLRRRKKN